MKEKILIIEDDVNILYGLEAKLNVEGFNIVTNDGNSAMKEVIDQVKSCQPDYIVLDLMLPKINGFDVITALVADQETNKIPIIVFTNLSDEDSKAKGLKLGATHYFVKSEFNIDSFVTKVKKIIDNRKRLSN